MTGIFGGSVTETALQDLGEALHDEPWYGHERLGTDGHRLGLRHHGDRDPGGHLTYEAGARAAVVHGAITNREALGLTTDELFESFLDSPTELLSRLDGPFVIAGVDADADRVVVATDRLGARPCYYHADEGLAFTSSLGALLTRVDDPTLDEGAVADMLLMGYVWGEKTLVEEVTALPPATVLDYSEGTLSTERYWSPSFDALPDDGYLPGLVEQYRSIIDDAAGTMDGSVGLWLSGGLDSRTMAAELDRHASGFDDLAAYTYDANPRGGGNPELAGEVAAHLDVDLDTVELTPDLFLDRLGEAVDLTDGMLRWSSFINLLSTYSLPDDHADVLLEGAGQGELMGHHLRRYHFTGTDSPIESMYWSEAMVDRDTVATLLATDAEPLQSFVDTAEASDASHKGTILDAHFANYYSRMTFASNAIPRSQAGTRVPFADREFLEYVARLPLKHRMRTVPLTRGTIPYGVTRTKLALTRALDSDLAAIRYERTGVAPKRPFPVHVAGFLTTTAAARLGRRTTYGGRSVPDMWYRNQPAVREFFDDLLDSACERSVFDGEAIRRLRREHLADEANHMITSLAAITTLELWLQRNVD
ncbi:asparagine synthase-related protein [Halococcus agarilyticus]|uniref:asparagine synthase-related protein n=1 Tax=Halococcus agarilyticus TaxID=1232219 RepID=UPI000677D4B4|nr:asparagine synthase-related protein [Halococcus agarilyticus]